MSILRHHFFRFLDRLKRRPWTFSPFERATEQDLWFCFRLLLKRNPDIESWNELSRLLREEHITLQMLVDDFIYSAEFEQLQARLDEPELLELDDFRLYARRTDFAIGYALLQQGSYEPHVVAELRRRLEPGMQFLDIGANIGYFSLMAAAIVGPTGHVIAFEPNLDNCDLIRRGIAANGFENVTLHALAVAEEEQTFILEVRGRGSNGRVLEAPPQLYAGTRSAGEVRAVVLDRFLDTLDRLDLVKMDIEGAEPRALAGMQGLIERFHPPLLLEFSPHLIRATSHTAPETFLSRLDDLAYDLYALNDLPGTPPGPLSPAQILALHARAGLSHLDLVARPRGA